MNRGLRSEAFDFGFLLLKYEGIYLRALFSFHARVLPCNNIGLQSLEYVGLEVCVNVCCVSPGRNQSALLLESVLKSSRNVAV